MNTHATATHATTVKRAHALLFAMAGAALGCSDSSAPARSPSKPTAAATPAATPTGPTKVIDQPAPEPPAGHPPSVERPRAAAPPLADSPSIDLVANRYRFHLYPSADSDHLRVPLASEGMRKYTREYRSPWGDVAVIDSAPGRILRDRRAALNVPIDRPGKYMLGFSAYTGTRRQSLTPTVNGERLAPVAMSTGWHRSLVGPLELKAGDNRIEWKVKRGERMTTSTGQVRGYGLWHHIDVIPVDAATEAPEKSIAVAPARASVAATRLTPIAPGTGPATGATTGSLSGFARLELYLEVPEAAWLEIETDTRRADADGLRDSTGFRISALTADAGRPGDRVSLLDHSQAAGQTVKHQISLADLSGQLIRLQLATDESTDEPTDEPRAAWLGPRIALEKVESASFQPVRNLVLLVIDTLRADHLPLYTDTPVRTRHIDAAASRGASVFLHNQAASPSSPPSHASIHTGTVPRVHGVAGDADRVRDDVPLLSALLRDAGLITGYVGNNNFAMSRVKKQARFHSFYEPVFNRQGVDCQPVSAAMNKFVAERADQRFFLSGLPIEPHVPYRFHEGITDIYFAGPYDRPIGKKPGSKLISRITAGRVRMNDTRWRQIRALYQGEVHYVDDCFGAFITELEARGRLSDTAIIITADHGEGMYEHGRMGHAFGHYAELSNVPFIVIWPPGHPLADAVRKHHTVTSLIDIAPTVLSMLGQPVDPRMQGRDMLPVMRRQGPWPPRVVPMEYGKSFALRARDYKYMVDYSGREQLYHVAVDPAEQREIAEKAPMALRYMRESAGFYLAHRTRWRAATWGEYNDHGPGLATYAAPTERQSPD